jgi:hypothetical protein
MGLNEWLVRNDQWGHYSRIRDWAQGQSEFSAKVFQKEDAIVEHLLLVCYCLEVDRVETFTHWKREVYGLFTSLCFRLKGQHKTEYKKRKRILEEAFYDGLEVDGDQLKDFWAVASYKEDINYTLTESLRLSFFEKLEDLIDLTAKMDREGIKQYLNKLRED